MATFKTTQVDRERPEEDFTVECASGNTYAIGHPKDVSGADLLQMDMNNPGHALRTLLGDDDFNSLLAEPEIDGWALDSIFTAWAEHYGLGPTRIGGASQRRSTVTPGRSKSTSRAKAPH